jgi:hypothetical protein
MFENLHNLLPKAIKSLNLEHKTQAAHIIYMTRTFLESKFPELKEMTEAPYKVVSYKDRILKIYCKHPIIAQEIQHLNHQLIAYIKDKDRTLKIDRVQTTTQLPQTENIN